MPYEKGQTAEEYLAEHRSMRQDFMTEEEILEADLMLDWFREAWFFKDANRLFDTWDLIDSYWAGKANEPMYADDIGSNTNIINSHIEGQVALSWQDPAAAYVKAVEPSDTPYKNEAQALIDFIVKQNRIRSLRDNIYRRIKKDGIAVCTVFWDSKALKGKGMPRIRNWSARYVYFDPTITDPQDFQDSRYVILATQKSLEWAQKMFGDEKAAAITPGYHSVDGQWDIGTSGSWDDYERENNSYIHLYVLTKRNSPNKVRMVQMSGDGVILREDTLIDDTYPVFFRAQMQCENHLYGRSTVVDLLPLQDTVNVLDDAIIRNAMLMGNPQKVVNTSTSGINADEWTNEPGLVISATSLDDTYDVIPGTPISSDVIARRNQILFNERPLVGRWTDNMMGTAQAGVDTATEAASLQATGMAIVDTDKRKLQDMMSEALEYALRLSEEYWTTEMAFRITGKESFFHIRPSKLKNIPLMAPASQEYIKKAIKKAQEDYRKSKLALGITNVPSGALPPGFQPPKYEFYKDKSGNQIYRQAAYDIDVDFGADVPTNKAYQLSAVKEAFLAKAVDATEYRQMLHDLRVIPYQDSETEQEITDRIRAQQDALMQMDMASAQSVLMNAAANNGMPAQGTAPVMQGMPGGTPTNANPGAMMPNAMIPGMTGNNRVANAATQTPLSLAGG